MDIILQIRWLMLLALPIASVSWTITHEEILKEAKTFCVKCSKENKYLLVRKFFYLFTCEYCFSHYVSLFAVVTTGFKLLLQDWRGYLVAGFALVWVANFYMGIFQIIRFSIKRLRLVTEQMENQIEANDIGSKIKDV